MPNFVASSSDRISLPTASYLNRPSVYTTGLAEYELAELAFNTPNGKSFG